LGHLGWTDTGRTHDAFKAMLNLGQVKLDIFASKVREDSAGQAFDEDNDSNLYGAYAVVGLTDGVSLDLYLLDWTSATAGAKDRDVLTYGARLALNLGALKATVEGAIQSGDWTATQDQKAYAVAAKAMYNLGMFSVGAEAVLGSGDDDAMKAV